MKAGGFPRRRSTSMRRRWQVGLGFRLRICRRSSPIWRISRSRCLDFWDEVKRKARHRRPTAHARARYRCFLPDLAGLAGMRRVGPIPDQIEYNRTFHLWQAGTGERMARRKTEMPKVRLHEILQVPFPVTFDRQTATPAFPSSRNWPTMDPDAERSPSLARYDSLIGRYREVF